MKHEKLKNILLWIKKNFFNVFGVVGVLGGFGLSLFYVPNWVDQLFIGRASVIHESIVNDVQEILFNNEKILTSDIESLIKGKELNNGSKYQYSVDELLVQVEDRFMSNKFIPLKKRTELVTEINQLRKGVKNVQPEKSFIFNKQMIVTWLLSAIGVIISIFGALSFIEKNKREREIKIDLNEVETEETEETDSFVESYSEFEKEIKEVFTSIGFTVEVEEPDHPGKPMSRPDFEVSLGRMHYLVECKKYTQLVGLKTIKQVKYQGMEHGKSSILISTTKLTSRASEELNKHNQDLPDLKIYSIIGSTQEKIKDQLLNIKKDL